MTNKEKMIALINRTMSELNEDYLRKLMVCADTMLDIQKSRPS